MPSRPSAIVIVVLAVATFLRSYLVTWLGERVVADLRRDVYRHVLHLSPGFFEVTRTGEVLSRLTTDTSVIQTVIGASVTQALRNVLLTVGGLALLVDHQPRLTGLILVVVPLVVVPIVVIGRARAAAVARRAGPHGGRLRVRPRRRSTPSGPCSPSRRRTGRAPASPPPPRAPSPPPPATPRRARCWVPSSSRWSSARSPSCSGWAATTCWPAASRRASSPPSCSTPPSSPAPSVG